MGCRLWVRTESDTTEATYQKQQRWGGVVSVESCGHSYSVCSNCSSIQAQDPLRMAFASFVLPLWVGSHNLEGGPSPLGTGCKRLQV